MIEEFVLERVLPIYANSHSEASFCGASITQMREAGRAEKNHRSRSPRERSGGVGS